MAILLAGVALAGAALPALARTQATRRPSSEGRAGRHRAAQIRHRQASSRPSLQKAYYAADPTTRAYTAGAEALFLLRRPRLRAALADARRRRHVDLLAQRRQDHRRLQERRARRPAPVRLSDAPTSIPPPPAPIRPSSPRSRPRSPAAALRYAQDIYGGRINPTDVDPLLIIAPKRIDAADTLIKLAATDDPAKVLADLDPPHKEFQLLKAALAKFYDDDGAQDRDHHHPRRPDAQARHEGRPRPDPARAPRRRGPGNSRRRRRRQGRHHLRQGAGRSRKGVPGEPRPHRRRRARRRHRRRAQRRHGRQQGRHHRQHGALALGAQRFRRLPRRGEHPRIHRSGS